MTPLDRLQWAAAVAGDRALPEYAARLASIIAAGAWDDGRYIGSREQISTVLQVQPITVRRATEALVDAGWITYKPGNGRGRASEFTPIQRQKRDLPGDHLSRGGNGSQRVNGSARDSGNGFRKGIRKGISRGSPLWDPWDLDKKTQYRPDTQ